MRICLIIGAKSIQNFEKCENVVDFNVVPYKMNYKILGLVVNMFKDQVTNIATKANLDLLCDVETFLSLTYIIPSLEFVQSLSKFGQTHDVFICDFVRIMKVCEDDIYEMYCDLVIKYSSKDFNTFLSIVDHCNEALNMTLVTSPNFVSKYVAFRFSRCTIMIHKRNSLIGVFNLVLRFDWLNAILKK